MWEFIKRRFARNNFSGLTLTVLLLAFAYISCLLAGLTEDIVTSDSIVSFDEHIASLLLADRNHATVEFFLAFTFLGQPILVSLSLLLAAVGLLWTRLMQWMIPLTVSSLSSLLLVFLGKNTIARPRPVDPLFAVHSFSFPSGHSAIAVSVYGFIGLIFLYQARRLSTRFSILTLTIFVIGAVLLSRMVLGVHYFSDVIGGLLVGSLSITLGLGIYYWQLNHNYSLQRTESKQNHLPKILLLALIFVLAWVGFEVFGENLFYQDQLAVERGIQ
ncbi:phosphatase PAP2 family protein [Thiomicrorhabdus heinhorstiae]|uniref:undecaprenyl-diphosphate phosphatase n=1 Tax=Thiomicrorhabdus heinhorstiae TaxID=2748010 RepID=A0ABS0BZS7_9GAMM|nr:phosphatase PAP2 family protein [Thiomicrorhabdus heinhorstiae]MBF6058499.1 phosphatase PAP2 family protein [Thiomicrorhabdus heinhorstiae]